MRFSTALCFFLSASVARGGLHRKLTDGQRTQIDVTYEYRLEVNNPSSTGSTENILATLDASILNDLQKALPNGAAVDGMEPNVGFDNVSSEIFSACFTQSDQCSLIRSTITVSYAEEKPTHPLELVTYNLVQDYLDTFTEQKDGVVLTYLYPSAVTTLAQFQMQPVVDKMSSSEIAILEETFVEVFGAILAAIEGDTEIVNSQFVYQDLFPLEGEQQNEDARLMSTDMLINGICRECTDDEFGDMVNQVIDGKLAAYKIKLSLNGQSSQSSYFANVEKLAYSVPELPSKLDPIGDDSIYDQEEPSVKRKIPWFVYLGIALGLCIFIFGGLLIRKEQEDFDKPDDTSDSESDYSGEEDETRPSGFVAENSAVGTSGHANDAYEDLEDYQVETIAATDDGDGNEVSVYVY